MDTSDRLQLMRDNQARQELVDKRWGWFRMFISVVFFAPMLVIACVLAYKQVIIKNHELDQRIDQIQIERGNQHDRSGSEKADS